MSIERYQRDRIELEQKGYRSARHLRIHAPWIISRENMAKAIAKGFFEEVDNGHTKPSPYYRLTSKGKSELKRTGNGFTYADARGRVPIHYCRAGFHVTRLVKISPEERRSRAGRLLAAYEGVVTSAAAHRQLDLEKKRWFPAKTTKPPKSLLEHGMIERQWRGQNGKTAYYRLTNKGRKTLIAARLKKLKAAQAEARRDLRSEQAKERRRLASRTDVRNWHDFPGPI